MEKVTDSRGPRTSDCDAGLLALSRETIAVLLGEHALADAVRQRRDLEKLVVRQEFDRVVEGQLAHAIELRGDVRVAAAHVREVLAAHNIHLEIAVADVLSDDHALIHLDAGADEELTALLGLVQAERRGRARFEGDERAEVSRLDRARVRAVTREERVHHALAARAREERLAETEQTACRDLVHAVRASVVAVLHVDEGAAPLTGELHDLAEHILRDLDLQLLVRLETLAGFVLVDDLGPRHLEFVPLAAERLDEDGEVQLA